MSGRSKFILDLKDKIEICCEALYNGERLKKQTKKELADSAGIKFDTLKSSYENGRISPETERRLAAFCGFEINDPSWVDDRISEKGKRSISFSSEYTGRDTADQFRQRLFSHWGLKDNNNFTIGDKVTDKNSHNLALVNLSNMNNSSPNEPMELFLQIDLNKGYSGTEYSFGFSEVRVYLVKEQGCRFEFIDPLSSANGKLVNGLFIESRGTLEDPYWVISSEDRLIEGRYWLSEPLIKLRNPTEGDRFEIELRGHLFDGSFSVLFQNESIGQEKAAVMSALIAKQLGVLDEYNGNVTLAKQKLCVLKA